MRIRRRPALSLSRDPSLGIRPQNGRRGSSEGGGGAAAAAGEGLLHLVGDLLETELVKINPSPSLSDPRLLAPPFPVSTELSQALKEEEEEDGDEEREVDSIRRCSTRINGSSGAVAAPSWEMKASPPQTHARGGNDIGNENGEGPETKPARERDWKEKVRASSASGSSSCTGEGDEEAHDGGSGKRRRSSTAAVLKEGSRCSRVNGRGWRCCQQTLVGYSLCEHHLGKGRLRSVTCVRGQLGTSKPRRCINRSSGGFMASSSPEKTPPPPPPPPPLPVCAASINRANQVEDEEEAEEEEEMERKTARKKKAGTVKARSISSLLENFEVSHAAAAAAPPREQVTNEFN